MKLKNKKTGEIITLDDYTFASYDDGIKYGHHIYYSLAELNKDWEDYEEPKTFWAINYYAEVILCGTTDYDKFENADKEMYAYFSEKETEYMKSIGNYFETKEEAERAVEMLKALKKARDAGFIVEDWDYELGEQNNNGECIHIEARMPYQYKNKEILDFIFRGLSNW